MRKISAVLTLLALVVFPASILAGDSSAILGTEDYFVGALPPPGFHFINYLAYYYADEFRNSDGDKIPEDFKADVAAEVLRGIYVSDIEVLGANLGWHVVVPLVYKDMKMRMGDFTIFDESRASLGDIYFSPFLLGWHSDVLHWVVGLDIIAPTGQYNNDYAVNIGSNHWTFEPAVAVSLILPEGLSVDLKLMYDFHTENTDYIGMAGVGDYRTGQQFHLDYNVGYAVLDNFRLGVGGYYLKGLQDDELDGNKIANTKEQVLAVGPTALYSFNPGLHLVAKVQFETEVENRPQGIFSWLKLIYSF
ncbi:MAG: transporter [Candidatus Erginobacter occultus]|nr:transporter [Candidatus Erginobacter occultus]